MKKEVLVLVAEGLQAAHEKSIVHRDIKSSNIMISKDGKIKIMDFGLAKIRGGVQLTKEHSTLGTVAYMSPEQARGEYVDHRSDIWSFGVVFFEILTGQLPFKGDYEQAVIYSILNEEIPKALGFITTSADKMDAVLSGLLRLSRLGQAALKIERLDMDSLISNVAKNMEYQIKESGVTLDIEHLPGCFGDASQINQVFSNLIDNAMKYLDASRAGVIHIHGWSEDNSSIYCVEDNGTGIAADHQGKIFEIFHRLEPEKGSGEGLGLTIVRRILDRHNGKVWVESEPGVGSKFFVSLPSA